MLTMNLRQASLKVMLLIFTSIVHQISLNGAPVIVVEVMVSATHLRCRRNYLQPGIYCLIKPAANKKNNLVSFSPNRRSHAMIHNNATASFHLFSLL